MITTTLDMTKHGLGKVELELKKGMYANGRLAIQLEHVDSGEVWCVLTVNIVDGELEDREFFVKAWAENKAIVKALMEQTDLFVDTFKSMKTGFVEAEVWKFKDIRTLESMRTIKRR